MTPAYFAEKPEPATPASRQFRNSTIKSKDFGSRVEAAKRMDKKRKPIAKKNPINRAKRNLICVGEVDERSIEIVQPDDLRGFTQCHFFAGIGVWSYALRGELDGPMLDLFGQEAVPVSRSATPAKARASDDQRHLWPHLFRLIASVALTSALANRLRARTDSRGSTLFR
jgi:hypothetical protein